MGNILLKERTHAFEWHDLEWVPHILRELLTATLQFFWCVFPNRSQCTATKVVAPFLRGVLARCKSTNVCDMCSGAGGPLPVVAEDLGPEGVTVTLSDLYPNTSIWEAFSKKIPMLKYISTSVDATKVPKGLLPKSCVRTFMGCFHHFTPPLAQSMLQDCIDNRHGVVIIEGTPRKLLTLLVWTFIQTLAVLLLPLWIGWGSHQLPQRLFFTYLCPVFTLMMVWDGAVSHLRCYTEGEMREMAAVRCRGGDTYTWEYREITAVWFLPFIKLIAFAGIPN